MATAYGSTQRSAAPEFPAFDDGLYLASVANVEDSEGEYDGVKYPQYTVVFDLVEELKANGDPHQMRAWIRIPDGLINGEGLNEKSKLYEFLTALGYDDDNLVVVPDEWQARELRLLIENKKIEKGERKGEVRSRITGFKPLKGSGPKAAERAQERRSSPPPTNARRPQRDEEVEPERPAREPARAGARARATQDEWD